MTKTWWNKLFGFKRSECVCNVQAKNLCDAVAGQRLRIQCLRGEEAMCERLREMGFCESSVVEKIADSGTLICKVCDAKVILSKGLAQNVIVKDICACEGHDRVADKVVYLSQMPVGQRAVIEDFHFESDGYERIEEMGVTPGESVEIVRYAPLGDPIEIKIWGYLLSLRKQEADRIKVKLLP